MSHRVKLTSNRSRAYTRLNPATIPYYGSLLPIVFQVRLADGFTMGDAHSAMDASVVLEPVINPTVAALMEQAGATRLSSSTWTFGLDEHSGLQPLKAAIDATRGITVVPEHTLLNAKGKPANMQGRAGSRWMHDSVWGSLISKFPTDAAASMRRLLRPSTAKSGYSSYNPKMTGGFRNLHAPGPYGFLVVTSNGTSLYIKAVTTQPAAILDVALSKDDEKRLDLKPAGSSPRDPRPMHPATAFQLCDALKDARIPVEFTPEVQQLHDLMVNGVFAYPAPGRPAEIMAVVGNNVHEQVIDVPGTDEPRMLKDHLADSEPYRRLKDVAVHTGVRTIVDFQPVLRGLPEGSVHMHPAVQDLYALADAKPVDDDRLRDYQRLAVGMHMATRFGYVNALEPGMGKTICAFAAARLRSKKIKRYRGLVVAEANVRTQWVAEAETWFPEALVVPIFGTGDRERLQKTLLHDGPVVIVASYAMAAKVTDVMDAGLDVLTPTITAADDSSNSTSDGSAGADGAGVTVSVVNVDEPEDPERGVQGWLFEADGVLNEELIVSPTPALEDDTDDDQPDEIPSIGVQLATQYWHDLFGDEAAVLRNPATRQSRALWRLRQNTQIAVALTGTPITRDGVDDLGRLIAWTRGDARMFAKDKLSQQFDVASDADLHRFQQAVGPLVFRRNKSDISEELPGLHAEVVLLEPSSQELDLARAARDELRKVYEELLALTEILTESGRDLNPQKMAELKSSLVVARGAWLGGTQLARMAASDPASLLGSQSGGAKMLEGLGLIEAATARPGTKRTWCVNTVSKMVKPAVGKPRQVLIFTEFRTVADGLITDLRKAGLKVGGILGGGGKARDRNIENFREGALDVLVSTASGKRGLNLQTASVVIHYDLPWTPDDVAQRTARVERIGSTAEEITVLFPVSQGTVEERIVALLAARAATSVRALDVSRGADARGTDMGRVLASLLPAVDAGQLTKPAASLLEVTAELLRD